MDGGKNKNPRVWRVNSFTVMGVAWVTAVFQWYRIFLLPGSGVVNRALGLGIVIRALGLGNDQEP